MIPDFVIGFADTEQYEGWHQFSNDPVDPGGATYSGVTQAVYTAWRIHVAKLLPQSVRAMTDDECRMIYKTQYWDAVRGDEVWAGMDILLYDIAVNSGSWRSIKFLQQALGVTVDGQFGLQTLGALRGVNDRKALIQKICAARMSFWHSLTTWWRFGKGWSARGVGYEAKSLALLAAN